MPLVVFHTRRVRDALKAQTPLGLDLVVLLFICAFVGALYSFGHEVAAPYREKVQISLSLAALPKYTLFSLSRGFAAYALSLIFTLVYGTYAAHHRRAEKVMIPAIDVLQSIPVLSFLPTVVLAMIALFPTRQLGLEIACILMIFTAQVWNMTFSFFGSLRNIPSPLREVTRVHRFSNWRTFKLLELPASMIGLVWNSMMSMAGGWFFLSVNEAFRLGDRDFRLPGIGSYMAEAIDKGNRTAMFAAVVAMIVMIVAVDQLFWRPIVVWSERFKFEDTASADKAQSWVLDVLQRSRIGNAIFGLFERKSKSISRKVFKPRPSKQPTAWSCAVRVVVRYVTILALIAAAAWGAWTLIRLLISLPIHKTASHDDWLSVLLALLASLIRTTAAVLIGAAWALPAGILIGLSPKWSQRLQPIVQVVASFPAPMLFPVVTLGLVALHIPFGTGCVVLMLLGAQWYILFNVIAGAMAIPSDLKEVGRVYRTSAVRRWFRLYIPCVFPYLVTGLVTAAGGAWNATIVSEYVKVRDTTYAAFGLGSIISQATNNANFPLLAAATVTMAVAVVLLNRLIWKKLYRLAENRFSLNT